MCVERERNFIWEINIINGLLREVIESNGGDTVL